MTEPVLSDLAAYLDAAAALHGALFEHPWSRTALEEMLSVPGTEGLAILQSAADPRFAGFVLFRASGDFAEILTLAVAKDFRRLGLGRRLMRAAVRRAADRGADRMLLEVQVGNESAISLYEELGMKVIDRRKNYYKLADGSHADALMMQLSLLV